MTCHTCAHRWIKPHDTRFTHFTEWVCRKGYKFGKVCGEWEK